MLSKKPFLILSLIILAVLVGIAEANHRYNLLEDYVSNPSEFKEREMGKRIVYWHQRKIGEAIVNKDYIVFQFDSKTHELVDVKGHWREDLPPFLPELNITKEQAESMVEGTVEFSRLYIISPESVIFSPIKPTPENPCWVVASIDEAKGMLLTVIDAVEGTVLGYAVPPPDMGFSLTGSVYEYPEGTCEPFWYWERFTENATYWFEQMGYPTEQIGTPTEEQVKGHIQSYTTAMFYELAHGGSLYFKSGCDNGFYEYTYASEIEDWISDYTRMPFAFIGSCGGMCDTNDGTLSYEFRKGSIEDTATIGYCGMAEPPCYSECWINDYVYDWQDAFFGYMNDGNTVKEAFEQANWDYPSCGGNQCMRFAGDPNFAVVPVVTRKQGEPLLVITKVDDVNDGNSVLPGDYITYTIYYSNPVTDPCEPNYLGTVNDVNIIDYLPEEIDVNDVNASDGGVYDMSTNTVTWEVGTLSPGEANSVTVTVRVNKLAEPNGIITNHSKIESDQYYGYDIIDTNVGFWSPDVIYVDNADPTHSSSRTGLSWEKAYIDLQDGLQATQTYDCNEIWVAEGTYYENIDFGDKAITLRSTNPNNWNVVASTIIDGSDSFGNVVTFNNNTGSVLTGFTIKNGYHRGVWCINSSAVDITNCKIQNNSWYGIDLQEASANITNCEIQNNGKTIIMGIRDGIYCNSSNLNITDCNIKDNGEDGINCSNSDVIVSNCIVEDNNDDGIYYNSDSSSGAITNNRISGNKGHGILCYYIRSEVEIKNNWIHNNGADGTGTGIYVYNSIPPVTIRNNTIISNTTYGIDLGWTDDADISNCIVWGNGGGEDDNLHCRYGTLDYVTYSCIDGGYGGTGNISSDPCFVDDANDNYHLRSDSNCIDTGYPAGDYTGETDIDGKDRVIDGDGDGTAIVDMGADEYYWSPADFNLDQVVNFLDYAMFANAWQTDNPDYSLDDDSDVDMDDLRIFCEDWLWQAGWTLTAEQMMMSEGMEQSASEGMEQDVSESPGLTEDVYPAEPAEQQQPAEIEPFDLEEILEWLDGLWFGGELEEIMTEDEYLEFRKAIEETPFE